MTATITRPLLTLHLPVSMDVAGALLEAVARSYPSAVLRNDTDASVLVVMVTEYVEDDDARLITSRTRTPRGDR